MSLQYGESDAIYYDNMEIMAAYEKRKKDSATHNQPAAQKITTSTVGGYPVGQSDRPPVLPPKKKNILKSSPEQTPSKKPVKKAEAEKVTTPAPVSPSRGSVTPPHSPKSSIHPGLLRTRSIVDEPLTPIIEEETVAGSQGGPARDQTVPNKEDSQDSKQRNDNSSRERKMPTRQYGSKTDTNENPLLLSEPRNFGFSGSVPEMNNSSEVGEPETVKPYGMIDLTWFDKSMTLTDTRDEKVRNLPADQGLPGTSKQRYFERTLNKNAVAYEEVTPIPNGKRAPTSSGHGRKEEHAIATVVNRGPPPHFFNAKVHRGVIPSFTAKPANSLAGQGTKQMPFNSSPKFGVGQDDSAGVSAYMSIPIHTQRTDSHKKSPPVNEAGRQEDQHWVNDEYMYDEIEEIPGNRNFQLKSEALKCAPRNVDEILGSMNNKNTRSTFSTGFRSFPMMEAGAPEIPRYDNFHSLRNDESNVPPSCGRDKSFAPPPPNRPYPNNETRRDETGKNKNAYHFKPVSAEGGYFELNQHFRGAPDAQGKVDARENQSNENFDSMRHIAEDSPVNYHPTHRESNARRVDNEPENRQDVESRREEMRTVVNSPRNPNEGEFSGSSETKSHKKTKSLGGADYVPSSRQNHGEEQENSDRRHSQRSDSLFEEHQDVENMKNSGAGLKGSTRSLGRSNSCERKRSSFRSKFKFRTRSKSQERFHGDSDSVGGLSSLSDVDDKAGAPRQRGSRLRRRLSRKSLERRGSTCSDKKTGDGNFNPEMRPSTPVSFIRKLLGKSKNSSQVKSASLSKVSMIPSGSEESVVRTSSTLSSSSDRGRSHGHSAREKHLTSPPSRRARKILHTRQSRGNSALTNSTDTDSDSEQRRRSGYKSEEYGERQHHGAAPLRHEDEERGRKKNSVRMQFSKAKRGRKDDFEGRTGASSIHRDKYRALASLNAQTLKKITEKWLTDWRNRLPVGGFLITSWSDIVIASKRPQCIIGKTVIYEAYFSTNPGHSLACQIFNKKDVSRRLLRQLENCYTLTAHPNLCSVCSHFDCKVPGSLMRPSLGESHVEALCVVLANVPATSLTTYIGRLKEVKEQKEVHKQILLMLLQLLQALDNLYQSGFSFSYVNADHLVVTQEMGLLQVLPHMDGVGELSADEFMSHSPQTDSRRTAMHHVARLVSRILEVAQDPRTTDVSYSTRSGASSHTFALTKVSYILANDASDLDIGSLLSLIRCALWGPRTASDIGLAFEDIYEALATWVDVKQAEIVNNIAVLFSAKTDFLPIYMFYKHQYFSVIEPDNLYENLLILDRI